jgi:diguanylate cyclase (GGDEF)-like protein
MEKTQILFVGDREDELRDLKRVLDTRDYDTAYLTSPERLVEEIERRPAAVVVVEFSDEEQSVLMCRRIRGVATMKPVQIVIVGKSEERLPQAIDSGVDDFVVTPVNMVEFGYRIRAAAIRLKGQARLLEERDFFRNAAKQEEELSSRILDQHMILKRAFQNIEELNRELEDTNTRLERVARFDVLSGLMNRLSLFSSIDMEIERAMRSRMSLSGIMVDVDNFKDINDEYGHLCGDEVISEIGRRLKSFLRKYDQAGRYGGEEFFIVLPNTNLHQSYIIAERFRKDLAGNPFRFEEQVVSITASFGIAEYRQGESREMWISRADRNMYAAKQSGRNRVIAE